jgi:hypothetical protein
VAVPVCVHQMHPLQRRNVDGRRPDHTNQGGHVSKQTGRFGRKEGRMPRTEGRTKGCQGRKDAKDIYRK